jgi:NAD(P)-dependent dehydrogenase (short-subunit alcohol dehydrogenase family)
VFVITGGGSGIGQALAIALAKRGQFVIITGRRIEALQQTASENDRISYIQADISHEEGRAVLVDYLSRFKQLTGFIHNAGIIDPIAPIKDLALDSFRQNMATNVEAPLCLNQSLLAQLKGGRVLHIGSGAAYFPVKGWAAYCTSKAALSMITKCWQLECDDPSFASVMPGIIDTPMQAEIRHSDCMDSEKLHFFQKLKRNNQLITCDTVALFLSWLLLDVDKHTFCSQEWDIYDTSHHRQWLQPPHHVPTFEE